MKVRNHWLEELGELLSAISNHVQSASQIVTVAFRQNAPNTPLIILIPLLVLPTNSLEHYYLHHTS